MKKKNSNRGGGKKGAFEIVEAAYKCGRNRCNGSEQRLNNGLMRLE